MRLAPILLFVYNRLWHTQQTIKTLKLNELARVSELYVYSDSPTSRKNEQAVDEVRSYLQNIDGFKAVYIRKAKKNLGLAKSITTGVTDIVSQHGKVIVLEDDMLLSPYFLRFMNEGLEFYKNEERVISLHGYLFPIKGQLPETFFLRGADCWGWGTWKRGWDEFKENGQKLLHKLEQEKLTREFDFDGSYPYSRMLRDQIKGKNDSWAVRWYASAFLKNKLTLYPGKSLVKNIGLDGSGRHCTEVDSFYEPICDKPISIKHIPIEDDTLVRSQIIEYFKTAQQGFIKRAQRKFYIIISNLQKSYFNFFNNSIK
jgi:hypothetical protein